LNRRIGAAILMCAVMVLVAAVPLALADTHTVVKGPQGPRASAVTWSYPTTEYGLWYGHIENNGLRSLVVDVYDDTNGMAIQILHQRIRFAAYDANPVGTVDTEKAIMAADRTYTITVTPNGPRGSTCTVEDMFIPAVPPTAVIDAQMDWMTVSVSGAGSTDDIGIVSYAWEFGDGATASGMTATHTYLTTGDKTITLTVTDTDGLTGSATATVTAMMPPPPTAAFTYSVVGDVLSVDASTSQSLTGIVSYTWTWGDGSASETLTTPMATHTYPAAPGAPAVLVTSKSVSTESVTIDQGPPPPPYTVFGYVTDTLGQPVLLAEVLVTDVNTGFTWATTTDELYGFYMVDLNIPQPSMWAGGDSIRVDVIKGILTGSATGIADANAAYLSLDVVVSGEVPPTVYTVTLTVADAFGQTASISKDISI
jgi:PKD repeat protein